MTASRREWMTEDMVDAAGYSVSSLNGRNGSLHVMQDEDTKCPLLVFIPYDDTCTYVLPYNTAPWPEDRADVIGQNGNDGEHYATSPAPGSVDDLQAAAHDALHPYHTLAVSLTRAYHQAAAGKGAERHANDLPFDEQRMRRIAQGQGHIGGLVYQVCKKAQEAEGMKPDAAHRELCGVIVYAAGAMAYLRDHEGAKTDG